MAPALPRSPRRWSIPAAARRACGRPILLAASGMALHDRRGPHGTCVSTGCATSVTCAHRRRSSLSTGNPGATPSPQARIGWRSSKRWSWRPCATDGSRRGWPPTHHRPPTQAAARPAAPGPGAHLVDQPQRRKDARGRAAGPTSEWPAATSGRKATFGMVTVRQKVSCTFRNARAAADFCRGRGYISIVKKHGLRAMACLSATVTARPFPPTPGPPIGPLPRHPAASSTTAVGRSPPSAPRHAPVVPSGTPATAQRSGILQPADRHLALSPRGTHSCVEPTGP